MAFWESFCFPDKKRQTQLVLPLSLLFHFGLPWIKVQCQEQVWKIWALITNASPLARKREQGPTGPRAEICNGASADNHWIHISCPQMWFLLLKTPEVVSYLPIFLADSKASKEQSSALSQPVCSLHGTPQPPAQSCSLLPWLSSSSAEVPTLSQAQTSKNPVQNLTAPRLCQCSDWRHMWLRCWHSCGDRNAALTCS